MDYFFSESFVGQKLCAGEAVRLTVRVSSPVPHPTKGFQCDVSLRFDLGTRTQEDGILAYTGKTPLRALGRALLAVDSTLDLRAHISGPLKMESAGVIYDADVHSAVPERIFEKLMVERQDARQIIDSSRIRSEEVLKQLRQVLPHSDGRDAGAG